MSKNFFKDLPLFAGLGECTFSDFKMAFADIFTNFFLSTMPIWLGTIITLVLTADTPVMELSLMPALIDNISNGELFLYATATLGPIVFIAYGEFEGGNKFPTKLSHFLSVIFVVIISAVFFGLGRANLELNEGLTYYVSIFMFIFSWLLLGLATVYKRQSIPSPSEGFKEVERKFTDDLNKHRGSL